MLKPIVALLVMLCSLSARADVAAKPTDVARHTAWMHAMEARVDGGAFASPTGTGSLPSLSDITAWLGWGLAVVSFVALIVGQVRIRRHNAFLLRAGERDDFIIRPPR